MKTEDRLTKIADAIKIAESHAEDMRLSYALACAQVECLKREAKLLTEK